MKRLKMHRWDVSGSARRAIVRLLRPALATLWVWVPAVLAAGTSDELARESYAAFANVEREMALGPLDILATSGTDTMAEVAFRVRRTPEHNQVSLVLAIPHGKYTSATIEWAPTSGADGLVRTATAVSPVTDVLGYVRGYRIARVQFAATGTSQQGSIRLLFDPSAPVAADPTWIAAESMGPIRTTLQKLVANPGQLTQFLAPSPAQIPGMPTAAPWNPFAVASPFRARIPVDDDGPTQFTGKDLADLGVPISQLSASELRLMLNGEAIRLDQFDSGGKTVGPNTSSIIPSDRFVFYGRQNSSRYSTTNTYWLVASPSIAPPQSEAARPEQGAGSPAVIFRSKATIEQDNPPVLTRNDQFLTILGYKWAWWTWTNSKSGIPNPTPPDRPQECAFDLPGYFASAEPVPVSAFFYAHSWPSAGSAVQVRISINDGYSEVVSIGSPQDEEKRFLVPSDRLRENGNKARLEIIDNGTSAPESAGSSRLQGIALCFDRFEIEYPRGYKAEPDGLAFESPARLDQSPATEAMRSIRYDLTNVNTNAKPLVYDLTAAHPRLQPFSLQNAHLTFDARESSPTRYMLAYLDKLPKAALNVVQPQADLHNASNSGDYLIVAAEEFLDAIAPFSADLARRGHDVRVIRMRDIYDQFSAGQETPEALRRFIRHASSRWKHSPLGPAASYVLFVGDSTSAYRDQFRNSVVNYVPSMSIDVGSERYASDQWFVTGFGDDQLCDSLIGRFSVNKAEDLTVIVRKNLEYRGISRAGAWTNTVGFVADHSDFESATQNVISQTIAPRFFINRVLMSEQPWVDNYYFPKEIADLKKSKVSPVTTAMIRDLFNRGAAMVTYFGHGSPNVWSNERIWFGGDSENSDNHMLTNRDKLSFVVNMTCNSGAIDYPMPKWNVCISEDFMRIPNGGAIACYVPSGPGITAQHERFTIQLNKALLLEQTKPLGNAIALANWRYLADGNPSDLSRMFILLGDPALELNIAAAATAISNSATSRATIPVLEHPASSLPVTSDYSDGTPGAFQWRSLPNATWLSPVESLTTGAQRITFPAQAMADGTGFVAALEIPGNGADLPKSAAAGFLTSLKLTGTTWSAASQSQDAVGKLVKLSAEVANQSGLPIRVDAFELRDNTGANVATYGPATLAPQHKATLEFIVSPPAGIGHCRLFARAGTLTQEATFSPEICLPPATDRPAGSSLFIDAHSVTARYSERGADIGVILTATVHNVSRSSESLRLAAGIRRADGSIGTSTSLQQIAPGQSAQISTAENRPASSREESVRLVVFEPETGRAEAESEPFPIFGAMMPDIGISRESIRLSTQSPSDGETVFFDVPVSNSGKSAAEGVRIEGYDDTSPTMPLRLESHVSRIASPVTTLDPGASTSIRLRWDPFRNAGARVIRLKAIHAGGAADANPANNETSLTLQVRTKAQIRRGDIHMLTLEPEDIRQKQVRIAATLRNDGETDAHGLKVAFYSTPRPNPAAHLGEVMVDLLRAQSRKEIIFTYKLKPGEETRPFAPSFDPIIKGSLQRIPFEGD